jgi:hypothetical protein
LVFFKEALKKAVRGTLHPAHGLLQRFLDCVTSLTLKFMKMTDQSKPVQMSLFGANHNLPGVPVAGFQTGKKAVVKFFSVMVFFGSAVSLFMLPVSLATAGTFYKCTDAAGRVLFTNSHPQGKSVCVVLSRQREPARAAGGGAQGQRVTEGQSAAAATPSDFPRVSGSEQRARDSDRRAILQTELAKEQQQLNEVRKSTPLSGNLPPAQREAAALHERNIKALQKELGNLRQ